MNKFHLKGQTCLMIGGLLTTSAIGLITSAQASDEMVCYAVADNDRYGNQDVLVKLNAHTGVTTVVGKTATTNIEAIAFDCEGRDLYAVDGGQLGTLDLGAGVFTPKADPIGTGMGVEGTITFNDIDGLTFDCSTGMLYGTQRREHPPKNDLLIQIDPITGSIVPSTFGTNIDYLPITGAKQDVDDIVWDSSSNGQNGELYIISNDGAGKNSVITTLRKQGAGAGLMAGVPTGGVAESINTVTIDDIESLAFASDGSHTLYGTTGDSIGATGGLNGQMLFTIDKLTGAISPTGQLEALGVSEEEQQHDFESLACHQPEAIPSCFLYAVHDEGLNDSQIIKIDPFADANPNLAAISVVGPMHPKHDIEGLVIVPPAPGEPSEGTLYGTSGGDGKKNVLQGALYKIQRDGSDPEVLTPVGLTGFLEVSGAALQYLGDHTQVWGWAVRKNGAGGPGPITIDLMNGKGSKQKIVPPEPFPAIESVAMSNDGNTLYGVVGTNKGSTLWAYDVDSGELSKRCLILNLEVEGLEMQPNGLLLFAIDYEQQLGFGAIDPRDCTLKATRIFNNSGYLYDIESIEWPADECRGRSWLYAGGGDLEIQPLPQYEIVSQNVKDAIAMVLAEGADFEAEEGLISVYLGDKRLVVQPTPFDSKGGKRSRSSEENCPVTQASVSPDFRHLQFTDCEGEEKWDLNPVSINTEALLNALNQVGQGELRKDGSIAVTLPDGTRIEALLDAEITSPKIVQPSTTNIAEIIAIGDGEFMIIYPSQHQQKMTVLEVQ